MYKRLETYWLTRVWALVAALAAKSVMFVFGCHEAKRPPQTAPATQPASATRPAEGKIVITIVFDNNAGRKDLTPSWGFACVIQGLDKTVLFDTGGDGGILLENMRRCKLDPRKIDAVVLSHIHGDHTGGLAAFLRARTGIGVYIPAGFPAAFKKRVQSLGAQPIEADGSEVICRGARTTGTEGKGEISEHGLCVKTAEGWVLITGCAHPGIAAMADRAKREVGEPIHGAIGGFHMGGFSQARIDAALDRLQKLGLKKVAPMHCSGKAARKRFRQRLGDACTLAGVGSVFRFGAEAK